ncbi:conjugal transfer protein TraF [Amedibacillus sp. YH-ame10]
MKKIICIMLCVFMMSACSIGHQAGDPIELTPQEVNNKLQDEKQNTFMLYLTTDNCYACEEYVKVIQEVEDESHFDIYYVNVPLEDVDNNEKSALAELGITIGSYTQLPMTFYFYQGSLLPENRKEGFIEKKDLKKWLKELHLIK